MILTDKKLNALVNGIVQSIRNNFSIHYVSGNLKDTIYAEYTEDGVKIHIPAIRYDMTLWEIHKVILPTPAEGSYAAEVDETGGWSGAHKNYAEEAVNESWTMFAEENNIKYDIEEI